MSTITRDTSLLDLVGKSGLTLLRCYHADAGSTALLEDSAPWTVRHAGHAEPEPFLAATKEAARMALRSMPPAGIFAHNVLVLYDPESRRGVCLGRLYGGKCVPVATSSPVLSEADVAALLETEDAGTPSFAWSAGRHGHAPCPAGAYEQAVDEAFAHLH